MDLHEAFTKFVKKYYEGYDYKAVKGANGGKFEYDFNSLDKIHKDIVGKKPKKSKMEDDDEGEEMMEGMDNA